MGATAMSVFKALGPLFLWGLKRWMDSMNLKEEQKKSYYAFLESIDKHTKIDVTNYVAAGNARQATIDRIKARRKNFLHKDSNENS